MKNKIIFGIVILTIIFLFLISIFDVNSLFLKDNAPICKECLGLKPKAIYKDYKIYDIIEQKGLACAEALEILDSDYKYDYAFSCLKSSKIYFVNDKKVINVHEAYNKKIITKEELYKLNIVIRIDRRVTNE